MSMYDILLDGRVMFFTDGCIFFVLRNIFLFFLLLVLVSMPDKLKTVIIYVDIIDVDVDVEQ